jgi:hypothetical protein
MVAGPLEAEVLLVRKGKVVGAWLEPDALLPEVLRVVPDEIYGGLGATRPAGKMRSSSII